MSPVSPEPSNLGNEFLAAGPLPPVIAPLGDDNADKVTRLLESLVHLSPSPAGPLAVAALASQEQRESSQAMARLGIATSLYFALRCKHPPTASHSLRVALMAAAWCENLAVTVEERDRIELAALLHDLGKLGIPDRVIRKPGKLSVEEQGTMSLVPQLGCEILRGSSGDTAMLDIVRYASAWYAGRPNQSLRGQQLPLGARMVAIADAYDSMTTDQTYRCAMSRELAVANLYSGSGVQFDPELTRDFCEMVLAARLWPPSQTKLHGLNLHESTRDRLPWTPTIGCPGSDSRAVVQDPFRSHLLSSMTDAVIFIDCQGVIQEWNEAAQKLTGISADAVLHRDWAPALIALFAEAEAGDLTSADCPVATALASAMEVTGRYRIQRTDGASLPIHLRAVPVAADPGGHYGVVMIARDLSNQSRLEERVESLRRQVTQDPLTSVANRVEMDRRLAELVRRSEESGEIFSLIICDVDHFKLVNDHYGHQAGDEALIRVAEILTAQSREGDLVCRYGGEEFVVLCPECDIMAATRRAEAIRVAISRTKLPMLQNNSVTACFGVTQIQAGDTAESVLGRADRALLQAKDNGRNQFVQIGVGGQFEPANPSNDKRRWLGWFRSEPIQDPLKATISTPVPPEVVIQKLRGFIADHNAEILSVSEGLLKLKLNVTYATGGRRTRDSHLPFCVQLKLSESTQQVGVGGVERMTTQNRTLIRVELTPLRAGTRRSQEVAVCARRIMIGINGYLVGELDSQ
jgi:diguanylate cyclase (GGDEF)-like protein/PAS domain S-box-containing protein